EAEREEEADESEERRLQDSHGLAEMLGPVAKIAAEKQTDRRRAEDDCKQDETDLDAAEAEEHVAHASERRMHAQPPDPARVGGEPAGYPPRRAGQDRP